MAALFVSRLTLAALFGVGVVTIQIFARTNNTFPMMEISQSKLTLPGSSTTYNPEFTGLKPIDDVLGFVLMFFWQIVDGSAPALSLISFIFAGQTVATWTITMAEGLRSGNAWKAISFTAIFGMAAQLLGIGMVAPLYLLVHTFLSPVATRPTHSTLAANSLAHFAALPASITLGYTIPAILMALPAPDLIPLHFKIQAHNVWQIFPVTCSLAQLVLSTIWPYNPPKTPKNTIKSLRLLYKFGLTFAVPAHIAGTTISATAYLFPMLFSANYVGLLHPANVMLPNIGAFQGAKAGSIAEGALWFIQWDYVLSGSSYLVWALLLRGQARRFVGDNESMGVAGLLKVGTRLAVLGPVGAATAYLWERDELVFAASEKMNVKKGQ